MKKFYWHDASHYHFQQRGIKCSKCGKFAEPEKMVLDTWATSSLTPELALNLIDNKIKSPFSLRPQAHDIIRTWAFLYSC